MSGLIPLGRQTDIFPFGSFFFGKTLHTILVWLQGKVYIVAHIQFDRKPGGCVSHSLKNINKIIHF